MKEPPVLQITFGSGEKDLMDLTAVTDCLSEPGYTMEVTLVSKNNTNKVFSVDFERNTEILRDPYKGEGMMNQMMVEFKA